jgi:hypothetical protein
MSTILVSSVPFDGPLAHLTVIDSVDFDRGVAARC